MAKVDTEFRGDMDGTDVARAIQPSSCLGGEVGCGGERALNWHLGKYMILKIAFSFM